MNLTVQTDQDVQVHRLRHLPIAGIIRMQVVAAIEDCHELFRVIRNLEPERVTRLCAAVGNRRRQCPCRRRRLYITERLFAAF